MLKEAEQFKEEDERQRRVVDARNDLERAVYAVKSGILDKEELKDKLSDEDKDKLKEASEDALKWLEEHKDASVEEYEARQKELESVVHPIVAKAYEAQAPEG